MAEGPNPTRPGRHNHVSPLVAPHDPAVGRRHIDQVFGVNAQIIEGVPIEDGHGCLPVETQLAEYARRLFVENGRDAARAWLLQALANTTINQKKFATELVARGLISEKTADASRMLDEFSPSGSAN